MITAYFDDSGTHDQSEVVLMAGIYGTEQRLDYLERNWKKHLAFPLDGMKPPLKRFHMAECQQSVGEFTGWTRTETDYFCHELATEIIEADVAGYGFACSRKDWDELVTGNIRTVFGDPEGYATRNCFVRACGWAHQYTFDPHMAFIFDNRPHRAREAKVVFDAFQRWIAPPPALVGISFLDSTKAVLLQAADMIAWELYQHAKDIIRTGLAPPKRKQFQRLALGMKLYSQIALRDSIERLVSDLNTMNTPEKMASMAHHFSTFDPDAKLTS